MRTVRWFLWMGALAAVVLMQVAYSDGAISRGPLDGRVFVGKIGPAGDPDVIDELHFRDGRFWSLACIRCGFQPGAYRAEVNGDIIRVRGELRGQRGTFAYDGEIDGDDARISIRWTRKRWYWTVEQDLEFRGRHRPGALAVSLSAAIESASNVPQERLAQCPR